MTNIKEFSDKVLAQSKNITELSQEGQGVDWKQFDIKRFSARLDSIKVVLNTTNATKDIGNIIICLVGTGNGKSDQWTLAMM